MQAFIDKILAKSRSRRTDATVLFLDQPTLASAQAEVARAVSAAIESALSTLGSIENLCHRISMDPDVLETCSDETRLSLANLPIAIAIVDRINRVMPLDTAEFSLPEAAVQKIRRDRTGSEMETARRLEKILEIEPGFYIGACPFSRNRRWTM